MGKGIAALALAFFLALLSACAPQAAGDLGQVSPTVAPSAPETVAGEPEGVAAMGEAGPEAPEAPRADESPTPAPTVSEAAPVAGAMDVPESPRPRSRIIALDPGHGGPEVGAAAPGLAEKNVNLEIALKLAELLRAEGYEVVLTRDADRAVNPEYLGGGNPGGVGRDLQARIDIANAASADLFISIHNNGSADPGQRGTEVWYNNQRPFAERNQTLAELVKESLLQELAAIGYSSQDRGIKDDTNFRIFRGRAYNLYVLGPGNGPRAHVPTRMPAVLGESLFLSNATEAALLRQERTLDAIAAGYRDAIVAYFESYPDFLPLGEG